MNRKLLLLSILCIGFWIEAVKAQTENSAPGKSKIVTIQIDGDDVLLNGKPLEQGKSEGNIILRKKIILDGDESNGGLMFLPELENESGEKKMLESTDSTTFLGVVTETAEAGVKIESVVPNSPAEKAGLKVGDILLKVNDAEIQSLKCCNR
jgi:serine protease Do